MALKLPTEEELRKLPPEERLKRLREMEELRRKELEETRKQVEQELAAAEDLIERTETQISENAAIEEAKERLKDLRFDQDNLEERIAAEKPQQTQPVGDQYKTGSDLYKTLPDALNTLENLYGRTHWNDQEVGEYRRAKEELDRAQQYSITSPSLLEKIDEGRNILNQLKYNR
jgi:hypothetical protein